MIKAFVVGHPIQHSRSPLIHGYWLKRYGLDGSYQRFDVTPYDFDEFLQSFWPLGFAGGNVTIPHKEAAFEAVDRRTDRAERAKAVNTIWYEEGSVLWGDNTDVLGFMAHLDQSLGFAWEKAADTVLVLGSGGAARAVVAGLQDRGLARIRIMNRTVARATALVRDLHRREGPVLEALAWEDVNAVLPETSLVVNTTSLGMNGQPPLDIDLTRAPAHAVVADVVYVPLQTPLLAAAAAHGLRTVDGLGMLLHQAAPGFARWFGVMPEVTPELRDLIAADIEGRQ
jgi:shikimate dehydrogenase